MTDVRLVRTRDGKVRVRVDGVLLALEADDEVQALGLAADYIDALDARPIVEPDPAGSTCTVGT